MLGFCPKKKKRIMWQNSQFKLSDSCTSHRLPWGCMERPTGRGKLISRTFPRRIRRSLMEHWKEGYMFHKRHNIKHYNIKSFFFLNGLVNWRLRPNEAWCVVCRSRWCAVMFFRIKHTRQLLLKSWTVCVVGLKVQRLPFWQLSVWLKLSKQIKLVCTLA